jgi:RNA recognition motif-containing protein
MSFTVFLGNLPTWVTADDIKGWLTAENLVADAIKVIRNPETQESKGFAFIDAPNTEEMHAIIRRFDRAPLEDRLLRANAAQPPKPRGPAPSRPPGGPGGPGNGAPRAASHAPVHSPPQGPRQVPTTESVHESAQAPAQNPPQGAAPPPAPAIEQRPPRRGKRSGAKRPAGGPQSAFAEELAKVL